MRWRVLWSFVLCVGLVGPQFSVYAHSAGAHSAPASQSPALQPGPLRDEVLRLRAEVAQLRSERRTRDVLGGLGMLAGLFGIGYYVAARRARRSN